jgi:hypothetical protein
LHLLYFFLLLLRLNCFLLRYLSLRFPRLLFILHFSTLILIEEEFGLIVGSGMIDVSAQVNTLKTIVTVINQLFELLSVGQQALSAIIRDI